MDKQIAKLLVDTSDGELSLFDGYSGRGMFGVQTTGVSGSRTEFNAALADLTDNLFQECLNLDTTREDNLGEKEDLEATIQSLRDVLANVREDNLGLDMIFY